MMMKIFFILFLVALMSFFVSCTQVPVEADQPKATPAPIEPIVVPTPRPSPVEVVREPRSLYPLSWEKGHPERGHWSDAVELQIDLKYFAKFDKAKDAIEFCPKYKSLNRDQKVSLWAELISAMAKYESSWNPKSASVDVGSKDNKDTWSVGLLQMSVVDQKNYGFNFGYDYEDLSTPYPNLHLGIAVLARQIDRYGYVMHTYPNNKGLYWAVLYKKGKFDKTREIISMTRKMPFCQ